jgi:hypothetical protein
VVDLLSALDRRSTGARPALDRRSTGARPALDRSVPGVGAIPG